MRKKISACKPNISVIIPIYNSERTLSKCINSVIEQSEKNIEVILINDGSKDSSLKICKNFLENDRRIVLISQKNEGVAKARNKGIQLAKGKYIFFLDSDDFLEKDTLEQLYNRAKYLDTDILFCDFNYITDKDCRPTICNWSVIKDNLPNATLFSVKNWSTKIFNIFPSVIWNQLFKKDFILKNNIYFPNLEKHEDTVFSIISLAKASKISFYDKKFINHTKNQDSLSTKSTEFNFKNAYQAILLIKEQLICENYWNNIKKSFYRCAIDNLLGSQLTEPYKSKYFYFLANEGFSYLFEDEKYFELLRKDQQEKIIEIRNKKNLFFKDTFFSDKEKIIPIVFSTDKIYALFTGVAIQSIIENANPNFCYDIYILHENLPNDVINLLEDMSTRNIRITCKNIFSNLPLGVDLYTRSYITKSTYYRFLIPTLFSGYDKILYLDSDLICQTDIANLFHIKMGDNLLAGVHNPMDENDIKIIEDELKLDSFSYINAGVILINLKLWKKESLEIKCWNYLLDEKNKLKYMDQDILNLVCKNRILLLPHEWNFLYCIWKINRDYKKYFFLLDENFPEPVHILHYAYSQKPWNYPQGELMDIWWKYARKTPFYELILFQNNFLSSIQKDNTKIILPIREKYNQSDMTLDLNNSAIHTLFKEYIYHSLFYIFSVGKKRKIHKNELCNLRNQILEEIK